MADLLTVGISVALTLTLQSGYQALAKFPAAINRENEALLQSLRLANLEGEEVNAALHMIRSANEALTEANDALLAENSSNCGEVLVELNIARAKLSGLTACKEPFPPHIQLLADALDRTLAMFDNVDLPKPARRLEALRIAWSGKFSLQTVSRRINEGRLSFAGSVETRASDLNAMNLEFRGAAVLGSLGVLGLSAFGLYQIVKHYHLYGWLAVVVWLLVSSAVGRFLTFAKAIADSTDDVVKNAKTYAESVRGSLIPLK